MEWRGRKHIPDPEMISYRASAPRLLMTQVEKRFDFGSISLPPSLRLDVHLSLHFKGCGEAEQRRFQILTSSSKLSSTFQEELASKIVFGNRNLRLTTSVNYTPEKCSCAKHLDSHSAFCVVLFMMNTHTHTHLYLPKCCFVFCKYISANSSTSQYAQLAC